MILGRTRNEHQNEMERNESKAMKSNEDWIPKCRTNRWHSLLCVFDGKTETDINRLNSLIRMRHWRMNETEMQTIDPVQILFTKPRMKNHVPSEQKATCVEHPVLTAFFTIQCSAEFSSNSLPSQHFG